MAVTFLEPIATGEVITVRVESSLVGTVFFHWWRDGKYLGWTREGKRTFYVDQGQQAYVDCVDTVDPEYDPQAEPPDVYAATRTLFWVASLGDAQAYRVDQREGAGEWQQIAYVGARPGQWSYQVETEKLDDLTEYTWRIVPVDAAGNDSAEPLVVGPELVVRRPDGVRWTGLSWDGETGEVTVG